VTQPAVLVFAALAVLALCALLVVFVLSLGAAAMNWWD
jgi:hypothetical protein